MRASIIPFPHFGHGGRLIADACVRLNGAIRVLLIAGGSTTELSATDARLLGSWPVMFVNKHGSRNSEPLPTDLIMP
jgi:hypothetical protein